MICFCLICDACSLRCSWIGCIFVLSCKCCVSVSCVQPDAFLLKILPHSRNCAFLSVPFFMGLHMNGTSWMNVSGG